MALFSNPFGAPVFYKESTASTMEDARRAVRSGAPGGTVCVADHQTAGRGRLSGRRWDDEPGTALLFTLVLKRSFPPATPSLTQLLALALCRFLERRWSLNPVIKWPNDVLVNGSKIAGILVETEKDFLLAGVGLNLSPQRDLSDARNQSISILEAAGSFPKVDEVMTAFLGEIKTVLNEDLGTEPLLRRLDGVGESVSVLLGDSDRRRRITGVIEGLAGDGALMLRDDSGQLRSIHSGEIERS